MTSVISLLGGDTGSPGTLNRIEELIDVEMALTEVHRSPSLTIFWGEIVSEF